MSLCCTEMDVLLTPWYKSLANAAKGANLQEKKQLSTGFHSSSELKIAGIILC